MSQTRYMLDTNIVSDLVRSPQGRIFDRIVVLGGDNMCVSIITAAELRYGCVKKVLHRLLAQIEAILGSIEILPFDVPAEPEDASIRAELEAAGKPIGSNDLLIAAHTCAADRTLVTANASEFERVRGLRTESWLA